MIMAHVIFYIFAVLAILSSLGVVFSSNSVRAALCLVATFVCFSALWILLNSEFLGLILVLVYVGAVMTLFLFVVMMLNLESVHFRESLSRYTPLAILFAIVFFLAMLLAIRPRYFDLQHYPAPAPAPQGYSGVKALGQILYTQYFLAFELSAVILLVAIVAAILLTFRGRQTRRNQEPTEQIRVTKASRLRLVEMTSGEFQQSKGETL